MPAPLPVQLRERVLAAYDRGEGSLAEVAEKFGVSKSSVEAWRRLEAASGSAEPRPPGGGNFSDVDFAVLETILKENRSATVSELRAAYNKRVGKVRATSDSSIKRALKRAGLVFKKKRFRPAEQSRPDVAAKRAAFIARQKRSTKRRKGRDIFLDEAGANLAMTRSHAWTPKGQELVEGKPSNWGGNLTIIGALSAAGMLAMSTQSRPVNKDSFSNWVTRRLAPKLRKGDRVHMDNLKVHKDPRVMRAIKARRASLIFLPPYSPDLNPIEPGWALVKKRLRKDAPRTMEALSAAARAARHSVTPAHARAFIRRAGYLL
jgi:transposase